LKLLNQLGVARGQMDASPQFIAKKKQGGGSGPPFSLKNEIGLSRPADI
jgi:hypothetical protein